MKIIKLNTHVYDIKALYRKAHTSAQRALLGYIVKAGLTDDPTFGGALAFLADVEKAKADGLIYTVESLVDAQTEKSIFHIAQLALDGGFNNFAFSKAYIRAILKALND